MSDKIARAMLARCSMNLFHNIPRFMMTSKLTYGYDVPFVRLLREYSVIQFGPCGARSYNYKGEFFYQCLKALHKIKAVELYRSDGSNSYGRHNDIKCPLEVMNRLWEEHRISVGVDEYFVYSDKWIDTIRKSLDSEMFPTNEKLVFFAVSKDISLNNKTDIDKLKKLIESSKNG
jgi:hypothetical protein